MAVAMVGTIWQTDSALAECASAACQGEVTRAAVASRTWEVSLSRALCQVEDGFLRMAGLARVR